MKKPTKQELLIQIQSLEAELDAMKQSSNYAGDAKLKDFRIFVQRFFLTLMVLQFLSIAILKRGAFTDSPFTVIIVATSFFVMVGFIVSHTIERKRQAKFDADLSTKRLKLKIALEAAKSIE